MHLAGQVLPKPAKCLVFAMGGRTVMGGNGVFGLLCSNKPTQNQTLADMYEGNVGSWAHGGWRRKGKGRVARAS